MTRTTPLVSIGLPVYNGERYLREAVDSLLAQTFTNFELIISDNASTDRTAEICREYAARDNRVRYVRNDTNIGLYRNCNQVAQLAASKYFKLAAADDVCHPALVAECVKVLEENSTVVAAYGKTRFIDPDGHSLALSDPGWHLISDRAEARLRHVLTSGHWVNLFHGLTRSADLAQTRLFAPYASGDYRLLAELSLRGKFFEIPDFLFFRRLHSDASVNSAPDRQSELFKCELPLWRLCIDHTRIVLSSDMKPHDKTSCLGIVLRRMLSGRKSLFDELRRASAHYVNVLSAGTPFRKAE